MRRTLVQRSGCAHAKSKEWQKHLTSLILFVAALFAVAWGGTVMAQPTTSWTVDRDYNSADLLVRTTHNMINDSTTLANSGDVIAGLNLTNNDMIRNGGDILVGNNYGNLSIPPYPQAPYNLTNTGHIHVAAGKTVTLFDGAVNNTGTFSGFGTINLNNPDYAFNNTAGGRIAPGFTIGITDWNATDEIGTLTINGDLNNNGGDFVIKINDINDLDQVVVNGHATIDGGTVYARPMGGSYVIGQEYDFLTAEELTVNTELEVDNTWKPRYTFSSGYDEGPNGRYYLTLQNTGSYGTICGHTFNQRAVGRYIDNLSVVAGSDLDQVLDELFELYCTDDARYALDQMGGAIYGTLANSSITNTNRTNSTLHDILRRNALGSSCGTSAADACAPACNTASGQSGPFCRNAWGVVYGTGGHTRYDGSAYGYDQSFVGGMVGLDKLYGCSTRAGIYTSYGEGRISSNLLERSKSKELLVGLYLRKEMYIGYMLLSGGLGYNQYDTERTISFMDRRAASRHNAFVGTVYGERGLEIQGALAKWQPFVGLQYIGNQQRGFTETGAGSLNLSGDITTGNSFRSLLGTRLGRNIARTHRGTLALFGQAYWAHEFLRTYADFTARFSNPNHANYSTDSKFTVSGNDMGRDWAVLGTGLTYDRRNWRLFAGYDISLNKHQVLHTGNAGFVYGW